MGTPVSEHFTREEFSCQCGCGFDEVGIELIAVLEDLRFHFGQPIDIKSGCRCVEYNAKVGGKLNSQHCFGRAADFVVQSVDPEIVQDYLDKKYPERFGLGKYNFYTHIDTRIGGATRWEYCSC